MYIMPFKNYSPNLKIELQDGKPSPIFSYKELHRILGREFTLDEIRGLCAESYGLDKKEFEIYTNFGIILFPDHEDHINEIKITYLEPGELEKDTSFFLTKNVKFSHRFLPADKSSLYVSVNVNDKYEIEKEPTISKIKEEHYGFDNTSVAENYEPIDSKPHVILDDKKHNVLNFPRKFSDEIKIDYRIKIPQMVIVWLWFGFFIGVGTIFFTIFASIQNYPVALGGIGVLIGLRIMLFHDVELLDRWNWAYLILIALNIIVLGLVLL